MDFQIHAGRFTDLINESYLKIRKLGLQGIDVAEILNQNVLIEQRILLAIDSLDIIGAQAAFNINFQYFYAIVR